MGNEVIDGRISPTSPTREKRGYAYYKQLVIELSDGSSRTIEKASAAGGVRDIIARGGEGRFFLSKHTGMVGIHGVRLKDGTSAYAHFNNMELILMIGGALGALALLGMLAGLDVPITPIVIGTILAIAYFVVRSGRMKAKAEFDAA